MRLHGWWFGVGIAGLALLAGLAGARASRLASVGASGSDVAGERSLAYAVPKGGELVFDLPPSVARLRIVTNGELSPDEPTDAEGWRYALGLELEAWNGDRSSRDYHFRSRVGLRANDQGDVETQTRYHRFARQPLDTRSAILTLEGLEFRPAKLRVTLAQQDAGLDSVAVRVYHREAVAPSRQHALWARLAKEKRERRAVGNVYPQDLLSEFERDALVSHGWSPLAPSGIEGRDYDRRALMVPDASRSLVPEIEVVPRELVLVEGVRGVLRLEQSLDGAQLEVIPVDPAQATGSVRTRSFDEEGAAGETATLEGTAVTLTSSAGPGWLEVETAVDSILRWVDPRPEAASDLDPESVRGYLCDESSEIEYRMIALEPRPATLRLDLRLLDVGAEASVRYRLLDAEGGAVTEGRLAHSEALSSYDWIESGERAHRVSEASHHYLAIPRQADRLALSACSLPAVVTAYNQPPEFVRIVRVPPSADAQQRRWYPVRPLGAIARSAAGAVAIVRLQHRPPPADRPSLDSLNVESLTPEEQETGRFLLLERQRPATGDPSELSWTYRRIEEGRTVTKPLAGIKSGSAVSARLLFRRPSSAPFVLQVEVDGVTVVTEEWAGHQGELVLPPMVAGKRHLKLQGDGATRFFLSHVAEAGGTSYARRFVPRLPITPFDIELEKRGATVITGRLFFARRSDAGCRLSIEVLGAGRLVGQPVGEWTDLRRTYQFAPGFEVQVAALGGDRLWVERSYPFFYRLGTDLADGAYRLRLVPNCAGEAYVTLSRLVASSQEERGFFLESSSEALLMAGRREQR